MPALPETLAPRLPSPTQEAHDPAFTAGNVRLVLKRDDTIHPEIPGNKWRKLAPNLRSAAESGHDTLLTFGGAYSHHLRATAAAGRLLGFRTIGVVRGEELADRPLNPTLTRCAADGMRLHFVPRSAYRRRAHPETEADLHSRFGDFLLLPEGGSNVAAVHGTAALGAELTEPGTVAVPCGTGGTLAGLAAGLGRGQRALGVAVLKGGFLTGEVSHLQHSAFGAPRGEWRVEDRFHCGGYARTTPELDSFAREFEVRNGLRLERVYVAKMLLALSHLAREGAFPPGSTVTAVVTGAPAG